MVSGCHHVSSLPWFCISCLLSHQRQPDTGSDSRHLSCVSCFWNNSGIDIFLHQQKPAFPDSRENQKKRDSQMARFFRSNYYRYYSGSCLCKWSYRSCNLADRHNLHAWRTNWSIYYRISDSFRGDTAWSTVDCKPPDRKEERVTANKTECTMNS